MYVKYSFPPDISITQVLTKLSRNNPFRDVISTPYNSFQVSDGLPFSAKTITREMIQHPTHFSPESMVKILPDCGRHFFL